MVTLIQKFKQTFPNQEESEKYGSGRGPREGEDDLKKAKRRQAMIDNIGVAVATLIMVVLALVIILLKVRIMEMKL